MPTYTNTLITGASSGLGLALACTLGRNHGQRLFLAVRGTGRASQIEALVRRRTGNPHVHALPVDLASLAAVRTFAAELERQLGPDGRLHGIACNAGLQVVAGLETSADGHELTFAVNHLAHFLLVSLLLPRCAPHSRVVFISSGTHDPADAGARRFGFRGARYTSARELARGDADPDASDMQHGLDRYATSKLCNIVTAYEWARRVPTEQVSFFAFDPGLMPGTGLARGRSWLQRALWKTALRVVGRFIPGASTPRRSAEALAWVLASPALAGLTGLQFDHTRQEKETSPASRDRAVAADLFRTSVELTRLPSPVLAEAHAWHGGVSR